MNKLRQFETLLVHEFEESEFHLPKHSHTYYELIYIEKGNGIHHINSNNLDYRAGDLFVISPDDHHHFTIKKSTKFAFIKFTDSYFQESKHLLPEEHFLVRPETLMKNKLLKEVKLVFNEPCKTILKRTIANIIDYNCRTDVGASPLMFYQILSIFGLIKEAMVKLDLRIDNGQPSKEAMISYINQFIYTPEKTAVKVIAKKFNISAGYFSAYFKRNFAINYREYLNTYRTKLIENRVINGGLSFKQIAIELGFNDESHLSNYFKSQRKSSPSGFRKAHITPVKI